MNATLTRLYTERDSQTEFVDQLLQTVEDEERDLVDAERRNLEAAETRIRELDEQIAPLESFEQRRAEHRSRIPAAPASQDNGGNGGGAQLDGGRRDRLTIDDRPVTYRSAGSFIVDKIRAVGYPGENLRPDADAAQRIATAMQTRADAPHNTTEETPGLLPQPIVGDIITDLDGSRPLVNSLGAKDMSTIPGKVFTRPKVTQHTQVDQQKDAYPAGNPAEKVELINRQFKVEGIPFTKDTFGGWLNVSRQDIDWTSPAAWDALINDLMLEYGADTDDFTANVFATGVTQTVNAADDSLEALIDALYEAARVAAQGGEAPTRRASALRLPNHIWVSLDQWAVLGSAIDSVRALIQGSSSPGTSSPTNFAGSILDIPRTMVPGLPSGSLIVGRTQLFEFYEERVGLLQSVEPKVLGVEVAYGGYAASGFLDDTAFAKVAVGASA